MQEKTYNTLHDYKTFTAMSEQQMVILVEDAIKKSLAKFKGDVEEARVKGVGAKIDVAELDEVYEPLRIAIAVTVKYDL